MFLLLIALLGFASSILSNISGGAGSLILLPALLVLGVEPIVAIGTIKAAGIGLVVGTSFGSRKKKLIRKEHVKPLLVASIVASFLGPLLSLSLSNHSVKIISSALIIITALFSLYSWNKTAEAQKFSRKSEIVGYCLYFFSSLFLAGFGSGIGLLSTYILINIIGMSALEAVSTRRLVGLVAGPLQLLPFLLSHKVDVGLGIALLLGSLLGGYVGLHVAIKQGNEFIKRMTAISAIVLLIFAFV